MALVRGCGRLGHPGSARSGVRCKLPNIAGLPLTSKSGAMVLVSFSLHPRSGRFTILQRSVVPHSLLVRVYSPDLHPMGMWLGCRARREHISAAAALAPALDFTVVDGHLTGIIHGFAWSFLTTTTNASLLLPPDTEAVGRDASTEGDHGLWMPRLSRDSLEVALNAASELLKACAELDHVQPKWLFHCLHGIGHG